MGDPWGATERCYYSTTAQCQARAQGWADRVWRTGVWDGAGAKPRMPARLWPGRSVFAIKGEWSGFPSGPFNKFDADN